LGGYDRVLPAEGYGAVLRWNEFEPGKVLNECPLAVGLVHAECDIHSFSLLQEMGFMLKPIMAAN
jgi:hypothetical protein